MAKFDVYSMENKKVGEVELADDVFAAPLREHLIHDAVRLFLANARQGTASTKTRGEVRGGGRKPFRQKGTGRARQGSTRSPNQVGGGTAFGPTPRDYGFKLNKKTKRLALCSALSQKVADQKMVIVDQVAVKEFKTKPMVEMLAKFGITAGLIVTDNVEPKVNLSFRNIPHVKVVEVGSVNVHDLIKFDHLMITESAAKKIAEVSNESL